MFRRLIRWLLIVGLALAIGGLIWMATGVFDRVHNTLTVIAFSILFGYLVYPPVKWLANRRIPEAFGILGALLSIPIAGIVRVAAERLFPPDPQSDALLIRTRNRSGDPRNETRAATTPHPGE